MKNTKIIITAVIVVILIILAFVFLGGKKVVPPPQPCQIGEKFNTTTGKPCPPSVEEPDPAAGVKAKVEGSAGTL